MDSISSVDTSLYSGLVEGFSPKTMLAVPAVKEENYPEQPAYDANYKSSNNVDLSNYYNEVQPEDILVKTGQNVVESAQALDNTMVIAMQNGYSVQDVCNIKLAEQAYKANAYVFKAVNELTTFELDV